MSMLAERKFKTKWSLNPRGSFWSNDDSKFGQKILEKMGWSKGKGLGKDEDGLVEPIRVRMRHDNTGLGFKENDEAWTAHNEGFETVLQSLQDKSSHDNLATNSSVSKMEVNSKKSKKRIHYHKFVRGKDLSKCSIKDFKSIFGKEEKFLSEIKLTGDKCDKDEHQSLNSNENGKHQMVESTESERRIKIQKRNFNEKDDITDSESTDAEHKNPKKKKRKKHSSDLDLNAKRDELVDQETDNVINSTSSERKKKKKSVDGSVQSEVISSTKDDTLYDSSLKCDQETNIYEPPCDYDYVDKTKHKKKDKKKNKTYELDEDFKNDCVEEEKDFVEPAKKEKKIQKQLRKKIIASEDDYQVKDGIKKSKKKQKEEKMKCSSSSSEDTQSDFSSNLTSNAEENNSNSACFTDGKYYNSRPEVKNKNLTSTERGQKSILGYEKNEIYEKVNDDNDYSFVIQRKPVEKVIYDNWVRKAKKYIPGTKAYQQLHMSLNDLNNIWTNAAIKTTNLNKIEGYPPR